MATTVAGRGDVERGGDDVAVEEVVEVLVGGDPGDEPPPGLVGEEAGRVGVGQPRGQLLQSQVDERLLHGRRRRHLGGGDGGQPAPLEVGEIDGAGDGQVVVQHEAVAHLLGRPPAGPVPPQADAAEAGVEARRVVRQRVLGQHVQHEGGAHAGRQRTARLRAGGPLPRHELVGRPRPGRGEMPVEQPLRRRRQLVEERRPIHDADATSGAPTFWFTGRRPRRTLTTSSRRGGRAAVG